MEEYHDPDVHFGEFPADLANIRKSIWKRVIANAKHHKAKRTEDIDVGVRVVGERGIAHNTPLSDTKVGRDKEGKDFITFPTEPKPEEGTHTVRNGVIIGLSLTGIAGLSFYLYHKTKE